MNDTVSIAIYKRLSHYKFLINQRALRITPPGIRHLQSEDGSHTHGNNTVASKLASSSVLSLLSDTGAGGRHGAAHGGGSAHHAGHH